MAELPFWDDFKDSSPWDMLALGEHVLPGSWTVDATCERELDVKKSKGKDGGRVKDCGYKAGEITFVGKLGGRDLEVTREQWREMQRVLEALHPRKKGGPRNPLAASHPALAVMGITTVYIKSIRAPEISDGIMTLRIDAMEWVPEPKKAKPKTETKSGGPARSTVDPFSGPVGAETASMSAQQYANSQVGAGLTFTNTGGLANTASPSDATAADADAEFARISAGFDG